MATLLVCVALGMTCPARGGQATTNDLLGVERGGHAKLVPRLEPIGDVRTWICIHSHEGAWNDTGDPYWGGLQMDVSFMRAYGRDMIAKYHRWADGWSPRDQMVVAERARKTRGYGPWPLTRRMCGV